MPTWLAPSPRVLARIGTVSLEALTDLEHCITAI